MQVTVLFTDVYGGVEHPHTETFDVAHPPGWLPDAGLGEVDTFDLDTWADEHLYPHTGQGEFDNVEAGYFAEIISCEECPGLVGSEFSWGV